MRNYNTKGSYGLLNSVLSMQAHKEVFIETYSDIALSLKLKFLFTRSLSTNFHIWQMLPLAMDISLLHNMAQINLAGARMHIRISTSLAE